MGEGRGVYRILVGNLGERGHLGDPGVDGRIMNDIFNCNWVYTQWQWYTFADQNYI